MVCKILLLITILLKGSSCQQLIEQEIENYINVGDIGRKELMKRPHASGNRSVHMYEGDNIKIKICPSEPVGITIDRMLYSNDGPKDLFTVHIDRKKVGTFTAERADFGYGSFWDVFKNSSKIGSVVSLTPGEHIIKITAESTDFYGTELDKIVLRTDTNINEYSFWCNVATTVTTVSTTPTRGVSTATETPLTKSQDSLQKTRGSSPRKVEIKRKEDSSQKQTASVSQRTEARTSSSTPTTPVSVSSSTPTSPVSVSTSSSSVSTAKASLEKLPFIQQLSYQTKCLDVSNVKVKFNSVSLKGVQIISKASTVPRKDKDVSNVAGQGSDIKTCKSTIWQIGLVDGKTVETGVPSNNAVIVYNATTEDEQKLSSLTTIDPTLTKKLTLRYTVPSNITTERSSIYFTIGLIDIDKETKIGVQYYDHINRKQSETEFVMFKPKQRVIGWALPRRAVSPSLRNRIDIFFDNTSTTPIKFDFLRLDHTPKDTKQKNIPLVRLRRFSITGMPYKSYKDKVLQESKGMNVSIDSGRPTGHLAKVKIVNVQRARRIGPIWNMLTITDTGELFPLHENRLSRKHNREAEGRTIDNVSGFVLGDPDNPVININIIRRRSEIVITFADSKYVRLTYHPEKSRTKLTIRESTLKDNSITFLSTYLNDNIAAVNKIQGAKGETKPIIGSLDGIQGQKFAFLKTSPNPLFYASAEYELVFPEQEIPK